MCQGNTIRQSFTKQQNMEHHWKGICTYIYTQHLQALYTVLYVYVHIYIHNIYKPYIQYVS